MWKYVSLFLLLELWRSVDGANAVLPAQQKPAKYADLEGCYIPDFDLVLPFNKPYSPQNGIECTQYTCRTSGDTKIISCGAIGGTIPGEGCTKIPGDKTLAYPNCCDLIKCPEKSPVENTHDENTPEDVGENLPDDIPIESTPVENTPVETSPVERKPIESTPKGPITKLPLIKEPPKDPCAPVRRKCPRGLICIDDPVAPVC